MNIAESGIDHSAHFINTPLFKDGDVRKELTCRHDNRKELIKGLVYGFSDDLKGKRATKTRPAVIQYNTLTRRPQSYKKAGAEQKQLLQTRPFQILQRPQSVDNRIHVILDTNVFYNHQLEDIEKLLKNPKVVLVVPHFVYKELDYHKDKKAEVSGQARRALKLLAANVNNGVQMQTLNQLQESKARYMHFAKRFAKNDEYIAWCAKLYKEHMMKQVVMISADNGLKLYCKTEGIPFYPSIQDLKRVNGLF